jgi:hypothetical protein
MFSPAHTLAVPPSPFFAGASPRRATIAYLGWRIPSPCLHRLSWSAHPIAAPPYRISLHARKQKRVSVSAIIEKHGASHCCTSIAYLGLRAHSMPHGDGKYQSRDILHASAPAASILM